MNVFTRLLIYCCYLINICYAYSFYTLDDLRICNSSIYLEGGPKSAAILKLTTRKAYDYNTPMYCNVIFMAATHHWSGLSGFFEEVDLLGVEEDLQSDNLHCLDYVMVKTNMQSSSHEMKRNCGKWSIVPGSKYSTYDSKRAVVGFCPSQTSLESSKKCHVTKLTLTVSIGNHGYMSKISALHKGFTFVVSAYSFPTQNGESECRDGLISCSLRNTIESEIGFHHCIHESLWCDGHINCGFVENSDEFDCNERSVWRKLASIVVGPWIGSAILLTLAFGTFVYTSVRRRTRNLEASQSIEMNSYGESYELSSNPASSHHMAIQVRVVCNSGHPHYNPADVTRWKHDVPPAYDAIFPQGPPSSSNVTTSIIATVDSNTEASVNVTSVATGVTRTPVTDGTTVQKDCNVSPSNITLATTSLPLCSTNNVTSIIDLNVVQNNAERNADVNGRLGNSIEKKTSLTLTVKQTTHPRNDGSEVNSERIIQETTLPQDITDADPIHYVV